MKNKGQNYAIHRMEEIGFDPETDVAPIDFHPDEPMGASTLHPRFWEGKNGSLCIGLMDLDGKLLTTDTKAKTRRWLSNIDHQPLHMVRKSPGMSGAKYMPGIDGMGVWPYLTKLVIAAFKTGEKIETLYFTEGYIKAFVGEKKGFPFIGLPGITVWKQSTEKELFYYIRMILEVCKPKRVIYITDADTFQVKFEHDKDLAQRPNTFYTSIKLYKKLLQDYKVTLIWKSISPETDLGKGIDDILINSTRKERQGIIKEMQTAITTPQYFRTWDVSSMTYTGIRELFFLHSPVAFYHAYEYQIGLNEFIFFRAKYQWSDSESKLKKLKSEFAAMLLMIGKTMYKKATKPSQSGELENVMVSISDKQLLKICGSEQVKKDVFHELDYYDGTINIPDHHNYVPQVVTYDELGNPSKWYNMYRPVTWKPEKGNCPHSLTMMKHIFGEETIEYKGKTFPSYEIGLDYMKLLWEHPKHLLPILVLFSVERHTGKTTFWDWMRAIFQQNVRNIRQEQLTGQFTTFFAHSLLVIIDEALVEKKATMERIKGLVTDKKFTLEAKYGEAEEVDNYIKVGMGTNNPNFAQIEQDEIRFWPRKVPKIEGNFNFDMLECLTREIPFFLQYLEDRDFTTNRASRAWFDPVLLETKELLFMKKQGKWRIEKEIEEAISSHFSMVKVPVLGLSTRDLKKLVDNPNNTNSDYRNVLENRMDKTKKPFSVKYEVYSDNAFGEFTTIQKDGMPYFFLISEFFEPGEIVQILSTQYLLELEEKHEVKFWSKRIGLHNVRNSTLIKVVDIADEKLLSIIEQSDSFREFSDTIHQYDLKKNTEDVPF